MMVSDIIQICVAAQAFRNAKQALLACQARLRKDTDNKDAVDQIQIAHDRVEEARPVLCELAQRLSVFDRWGKVRM